MPVGRDGESRNKGSLATGREIPDATPPPYQSRAGAGEEVPCRCGCGQRFRQFDDEGRERQYVRGHYSRMIWRLYKEHLAKGLEPFR